MTANRQLNESGGRPSEIVWTTATWCSGPFHIYTILTESVCD